jgi:hypothetical protein
MSATSLKLPDDLKRRIARLAASTGQAPHAFMVDALAREARLSSGRFQKATWGSCLYDVLSGANWWSAPAPRQSGRTATAEFGQERSLMP